MSWQSLLLTYKFLLANLARCANDSKGGICLQRDGLHEPRDLPVERGGRSHRRYRESCKEKT